jgi:hypothetical protein
MHNGEYSIGLQLAFRVLLAALQGRKLRVRVRRVHVTNFY